MDQNPRTRTFGDIKRGPDGRFADDDIARILQDATDKGAGAYRARGSPAVLRLVEILGMTQARQWGVCTMNEFRAFLGLKQFESFEEWNSDPEIAVRTCSWVGPRWAAVLIEFHDAAAVCARRRQNTARQLYGHIDNLELYPGLQAEVRAPILSVLNQ